MSTLQAKNQEGIKRIEFLKNNGMKFGKQVLDTFKSGGVGIFENQGMPFRSVYYSLYLNKGQKEYDEIIEEKENFEKEYQAKVYLILISHTEFGKLVSMLYVSNHNEEWNYDNEDLKEKVAYAYVFNQTDNDCSEIGSIAFEYDSICGGIYRIG